MENLQRALWRRYISREIQFFTLYIGPEIITKEKDIYSEPIQQAKWVYLFLQDIMSIN